MERIIFEDGMTYSIFNPHLKVSGEFFDLSLREGSTATFDIEGHKVFISQVGDNTIVSLPNNIRIVKSSNKNNYLQINGDNYILLSSRILRDDNTDAKIITWHQVRKPMKAIGFNKMNEEFYIAHLDNLALARLSQDWSLNDESYEWGDEPHSIYRITSVNGYPVLSNLTVSSIDDSQIRIHENIKYVFVRDENYPIERITKRLI